jgi:uncharacterized protein
MNSKEKEDSFRELLNKEYSWPVKYTFKFILPAGEEKTVEDLFKMDAEINKKPSSGGKYISITVYAQMTNADEILAIYRTASSIPGIVSL